MNSNKLQIKQIILSFASAGLCLFLAGCTQNGARGDSPTAAKEGPKPVDIQATEVARREIARSVDIVGSLLPFEEVTVSSEVDGRVEKVLADIGDQVRQGQVLVQISPEELQYQLNGKQAQLRQALAKLGMKDENAPVPPDDRVPDVQKAAADQNQTENDYERAKNLFDQALIAKEQLDAAETKYAASRAGYEATIQQVQVTKASIDQDRADLDLAKKKLRDAEIKAPFSGWIQERQVSPGQYLRVQTPVFTLVDVNPLRFTADVPDRIAPWVKVGNEVQLHIEAYPDRTFQGKIARIGPSSSQQSRSFTVEALVDNAQGLLKPGFFAKATIETQQTDSILTVPYNSVSFAYGVYKIYTVQNDEISLRDVEIGDRFGDDIELISGAKEHELVAVSNLAKLKDGTKVQTGRGGEPGSGGGAGGSGGGQRGSGKGSGEGRSKS